MAIVAGLGLYVLVTFFAGLEGQPVDIFEYEADTGLDRLNLVASLSAFVFVIGILLELGNAAYSWNNGIRARGHDPWAAATLEWYALSPPPPHNFDAVPDVRSSEPLRDIREAVRLSSAAFSAPASLERIERPEPEREPAPDPEPEPEPDDEGTSVA